MLYSCTHMATVGFKGLKYAHFLPKIKYVEKCVITIFSYVLRCKHVLKVSVRGCFKLNTETLVLSCLGCYESF